MTAPDTKVRAAFDRLPGDTTWDARPTLTGKGVNRWTPNQTAMMGVVNRKGTAQKGWNWATVTSGEGTDSITWTYNWGADSLIAGENFVCAVPLESDAGITNNLGLGTPFAGNLEVYPVYRMGVFGSAVGERRKPDLGVLTLSVFPNPCRSKTRVTYSLPRAGNVSLKIYDVAGKLTTTLVQGRLTAGDHVLPVGHWDFGIGHSHLARGVYVLRLTTEEQTKTQKLIVE
jgi:hypothetical protein